MTPKRIQWPDLLKAFAIILVVIGHVVSTYDSRGYNAPIALWIYSFHMPLFMMLSGMFFKYTLDKPFWPMLITKCRTLLLPLISWSFILLGFQLVVTVPFNEWTENAINWLSSGGPLHGYWYLKCLFMYLITGYLAVKLFKNQLLAATITSALFIMLPNINFSRMMILFFWIGYGYSVMNQKITNRGGYVILFAISMIIFYIVRWYDYTYLGTNGFIEYCKFIAMGTSAALFWILYYSM